MDGISTQLLEQDAQAIASYQHLSELPLVIKGGHGCHLIDADDKEYIDLTAGACTMNLGYTPLEGKDFASFPFPYATGIKQLEYAEALREFYPGIKPGDLRVGFGVCGSEAIDGVIKLCRAYTGRKKIVSFQGDYHGTTYGAVTLTTLPGRISQKFAPLLPEVHILPFCSEEDITDSVDEVLLKLALLDYETIAGIIVEPVQGDMGMIPMHHKLMHSIAAIAKAWDIQLVSDETQMSFYRSGPFYGIENYQGVVPDAVVMGKHLGGGIPLSAIIGRKELMSSLGRCEHAFSMAGTAEACARGLVSLKTITDPKFKAELEQKERQLAGALQDLKLAHPKSVAKITGLGFAYGLWIRSPLAQYSDEEAAYLVMRKAFDLGLYTMRLGSSWLRIEPPLNISPNELQEAFKIFDEALTALEQDRCDKETLKDMLRHD